MAQAKSLDRANDIAATLGLAAMPTAWARAQVKMMHWGIPLVLISGIAAYVLWRREPAPLAYVTVEAKRGDVAAMVTATGTLAPLDTVDVGTEVSGVVDVVSADFNDRVRKGQTLAVINTDQLQDPIRRNLMRSALTILGVVIGVAAVIAMVTLGSGTTARVTASIQSLGSNLLIVTPGAQAGRGAGATMTPAPPFTIRDVTAIAENVAGVDAVAPIATARAQVIAGDANWPTTITGTTNDFFIARDWPVSIGRQFTDAEILAGRAVCLLGTTVRNELFAGQDPPLGASIRIGNVPYEVIGVLASKGQAMGGNDQDDIVLLPLRTVQRRINGNDDVNAMQLSVESSALTARVTADLDALLRERRHLPHGKEDDFRILNIAQIANTVESTTRVLTAFLSALAAVSLLVGGIGIMNIMLVSVTERTREIGIRLAIGAMERDVLAQFLAEAIALSLLGGVIGIALGLAGSYVAVPMLSVPFAFNPTVVLVAFGFSGAVGVIFGYFPARKAARLDPIDALRHE